VRPFASRLAALTIPFFLLSAAAAGRALAAESGFNFLRAPVSARAAALGGAGSALLEGASSLYTNPAGIAAPDGKAASSAPWGLACEASFVHYESLADLRQESVVLLGAKGPQAVALSFTSLYSESIELRDEVGLLEGHFGLTDLAAGLTYGVTLGGGWRGGISGYYVDETFAGYGASTWSIDLGARYDLEAVGGLQFGLAFLHLGPAAHFDVDGQQGDPVSLPSTGQAGAAYRRDVSGKSSFLVTAEARKAKDDNYTGHFGGEFLYDLLVLRAGYRAGVDEGQFSAGLGVHAGDFRLDYAFGDFGDGLGTTHRFELDISFGL
jgi:hypothetical protein